MHSRQGAHAGYSAQSVVDDQHGLIVHSDIVNDNNDLGQVVAQLGHIDAVFGRGLDGIERLDAVLSGLFV